MTQRSQPTQTNRPLTHAERGRLGGRKTAERWGSDHMAEVGSRGALSTAERHFQGDAHAMMAQVRSHLDLAPEGTEWCPRNLCYVPKRAN